MSAARIRVLVVDDSAFARKVLRETLAGDRRFEVVGYARDGLEALERVAELRPDVMTLDLVMPNLDGLGVLAALPAVGAPRVVIVSMADSDSALGLAALAAGAIDIVHKPTALATERLYELADDLRAKVAAAAQARRPEPDLPADRARSGSVAAVGRAAAKLRAEESPSMVRLPTKRRLVVIGASTGGPQALTRIARQLPANFPVPVAIVLHMPVGYTSAFAERLDGDCALKVVEASDGALLRPGMVAVARAGIHLKVERDQRHLRTRLDVEPSHTLHRPSVDALFESVSELGEGVLAVVLTGMGEDGLAGSRAIRAAGGAVLTESSLSCVVYGMPRAVYEAGLANDEAPLGAMTDLILRHL